MPQTIGERGGFLVVRRIDWLTELPFTEEPVQPMNVRRPAGGLSHEEVRFRYRGFDAWPWPDDAKIAVPPLTDGLAAPSLLPAVEEYYSQVSKLHQCDLIYLNFTEDLSQPINLPGRFKFLGYDYGYYVWEYNYFSSLLHEVIFGIYDDLTKNAEVLNGQLLLPNIEAARALHGGRSRLLETDADLERNGEVLVPVAIYGTEDPNSTV